MKKGLIRGIEYVAGLLGLIVLMWTPHTYAGFVVFGGLVAIVIVAITVLMRWEKLPK